MATMEQKKASRLRLTNYILAALGDGLWKVMGESAVGLTTTFGKSILSVMEKEMGLELAGESVEDWAAEIGRLLVDEFDVGTEFRVEVSDDSVSVYAEGCMFAQVYEALEAAGVPAYICPVRAIYGAALRQLGEKVRLGAVERDGDKCSMTFVYF